jgi:hypothetical protein
MAFTQTQTELAMGMRELLQTPRSEEVVQGNILNEPQDTIQFDYVEQDVFGWLDRFIDAPWKA